MNAKTCYDIFNQSITDYHKTDHVDAPINNPYSSDTVEHLLYLKNWIDTVQWHLEDIIRDPQIELQFAIEIKRRIDASNQHRTDVVEQIDDYFLHHFKDVTPQSNARLNTESPAWVIDRMSILCLKIYHMQDQAKRTDVNLEHLEKCKAKLNILLEQQHDLGKAFEELLEDISKGDKYMKVYRQMKMYNDENLNPSLYNKK
jgi:Mg2+ and Co2+ transporter CorA